MIVDEVLYTVVLFVCIVVGCFFLRSIDRRLFFSTECVFFLLFCVTGKHQEVNPFVDHVPIQTKRGIVLGKSATVLLYMWWRQQQQQPLHPLLVELRDKRILSPVALCDYRLPSPRDEKTPSFPSRVLTKRRYTPSTTVKERYHGCRCHPYLDALVYWCYRS